jgi:hypothetical protein
MNPFPHPHFLQTNVFLRKIGGAEEARTPDPLLAKQVLFQLSYSPTILIQWWAHLESNQRPLRYQHSALTN